MKLVLSVLLILPLIFGISAAGDEYVVKKPVPFDGTNIAPGNINEPYGPRTVSNSPGEVVGVTYYAYQTNGSTGNRISIDQFGGIHISWMKGTQSGGRPRFIYYNFKSEETGQWLGETSVSSENGTGFVTMDLMGGGEAVPCYHFADATPSYTGIAKDLFRGFGIFEEFPVTSGNIEWIWPYIARNNTDGLIHVLVRDYNSSNYGYTFSDDDGVSWARATTIFATDILSGIICTSPVSSKTAIIYTMANEFNWYDVLYFETTDGETWNWGDPINITEFGSAPEMEAWADVDGLYDYNDNLHISYQGQTVDLDQQVSYIWGNIMHWSEATGHSVVYNHPSTDTCSTVNYCTCMCKMSLGVNPDNGNLYCLWSDLSQNDVSLAGYSNGELFAAASADNGASWFEHVNLTNSHTPDCGPPDCDSDIYSSLAEKVDGNLHIMYIDDDDPGAEWNNEGSWTLNNVLYLQVPEGDLLPLGVNDNPDLPFAFKLDQNYPNPFNANTLIRVDGDFESGRLGIYDIAGRLVKDFALNSDIRDITWDGTDKSGKAVASGTYFYSVDVDGYGTAGVKKMTLLK